MIDFEAGKRAMEALAAQYGASDRKSNEANTRLHIIDQLLQSVLGWPNIEIDAERHWRGKYSDFELGAPPALLVEAKREGAQFEIPAGCRDTLPINDLAELSSDIKDAIDQAMTYAQSRGIGLAAITNGHQLAAFVASRQDGVAPHNGRALIFRSLTDMVCRFSELWQALSAVGVRQGFLETRLSATVLIPPPSKLSASILGYPGYKNRNPAAADLQILGGLFLEDITREPEFEHKFLEETYCSSGALSQYALVSKDILRARYSQAFEQDSAVTAEPAVGKKGVNPRLTSDIFAAALRRRPVLLVGDVGAGKSMFIRHLIKIDAEEEFKKSIVLYLDFGSKPAIATEIQSYVAGEIKRQLLELYSIDIDDKKFVKGTYHSELKRFENGIFGDLKTENPSEYAAKQRELLAGYMDDDDGHLRRSFEHIRNGRRKQIVVFLDNVDQRLPPFQEEVFLIAQAFAEHWPATVFVSLRPETFAKSRDSGTLSAYQPRVFTIEPPRVDRVLSRRIRFALRTLENSGSFRSLPENVSFRSDSLLSYLHVLERALPEGANDSDIVEMIDNMSGGNLRKALDFVSSFIGSGHVDSRKIIDIERKSSYTLPLHEFLRAVMFGDKSYYDPATSPIPNVLDIASADGKEHFLVSLIVGYVEAFGQSGERKGYAPRADIMDACRKIGFHPVQVQNALARSLDAGLIATPSGIEGADSIRVTTRGAYATKRLLRMFSYLDAVVTDTPITDDATRRAIRDVSSIDERVARCRKFAQYLDREWEDIGYEPTGCTFAWPDASNALQKDIDRVVQSAKKRKL